MLTYLYCLLTPPKTEALPSGLTGIAGAPVRAVASDREGLEAWVATIDEKILHATGNALAKLALVHNEVVEAALATGRTPLPARFGARFVDDDALLLDLEERRAGLLDLLHRVADTVEMSVLVVPTRQAGKPPAGRPRRDEPAPGRRYLESLRERTRSEEQLHTSANIAADRVSQAVSAMARGEVRSTSSSLLSIAHLVRVGDVDRYRVAVSELDLGSDFRVIVGGPHAPYSFGAEYVRPSQARI